MDLTYEETIELEKNVKIKDAADDLYKRFKKNVTLSVGSLNRKGEFEDWSDAHNRTYYTVENGMVFYHCRFIHETYDLSITPSSLFNYIKRDYRGLAHFRSSVTRHEKANKLDKQ